MYYPRYYIKAKPMRMTIKGQVTIPAPIRRKLALGPGDTVQFVEDGDKVVVLKAPSATPDAKRARFEAALDRFIGSASDSEWTADQILDATRGPERRH